MRTPKQEHPTKDSSGEKIPGTGNQYLRHKELQTNSVQSLPSCDPGGAKNRGKLEGIQIILGAVSTS